jgi:hypothetical protein
MIARTSTSLDPGGFGENRSKICAYCCLNPQPSDFFVIQPNSCSGAVWSRHCFAECVTYPLSQKNNRFTSGVPEFQILTVLKVITVSTVQCPTAPTSTIMPNTYHTYLLASLGNGWSGNNVVTVGDSMCEQINK